jgi:hypothetical protein
VIKRIVGVLVVGGVLTIGYFTYPGDEMPEQLQGQYFFIVYSVDDSAAVNDLGIDIGKPKIKPSGDSCMTNRNGNVPFSHDDLVLLGELNCIVPILSDSIHNYEADNGWNVEEEL